MISRLLFLYIANSKLIVPRKVTDAIDCGSHIDQRSSIGVKFKKDSNFSIDDSHPVDYYHDPQFGRPIIKFSEDTSLYMTQRQSDNPFYYYLSLGKQFPEKQKYTLILKFAELYWKESGKRIFNVNIGSKQVIKELDVYNISGFSAAHDEYIEIEIDEGYVIHEDQTIKGALNMNNSLIIGFVPVVDRAMISAIYLFKGLLNETDYYDKENLRRKWDTHDLTFDERRERRQKKQEAVNQKIKEKQEIIKIRSGFEHEIQVEEIQQNMKINKEPERPQLIWPEFSLELLFIMIQTPLGIIMLIGFLTVSFVTFYFTFFDPYGMKAYQRRVRELELRTLPEKYIPVAQRAQKID